MAIPTTSQSKVAQIIEAASKTINNVVLSISPTPPDRPRQLAYRADWFGRYEAIKDLNVITVKSSVEYLEAPMEEADRYPYLGFVVDQVMRDTQQYGEELFTASLGAIIGVKGETFPISLYEIHEIHKAVCSILYLDKSLGEISQLGGQIEKIRFDNYNDPIYDKIHMKNPWMTMLFSYQIWYREEFYR
jgi:hypothetical protein